MWSQQVLLVFLTHISHALVLHTAIRVVRACEDTLRGIGKVKFHIFKIAGLKIGSIAGCIDNAEVGLHAQRFGQGLQQIFEVVHGFAAFQGIAHQFSLTVHVLHAVVAVQIVGSRVHYGEASLVKSHPCGSILQVSGIEQCDELHQSVVGLDTLHAVIQVVCIAVFPHQWPAVGRQLSAHDSRCAGIHGQYDCQNGYQGHQYPFSHIVAVLND